MEDSKIVHETFPKTRISPVFRLKVTNIDPELEKDAIDSIFSEYGKVTGVQIIKQKQGKNLAYVTFSNYRQAEHAINALNDKLPLQLGVEFQDKNLKNLQIKPESDTINRLTNINKYSNVNITENFDYKSYELAPENEDEEDSGMCKICSSPTPFKCHQCQIIFYCSKNCQVEDWPKHQFECQPVPPLSKKIKKKPSVQDNISVDLDHNQVEKQEGLLSSDRSQSISSQLNISENCNNLSKNIPAKVKQNKEVRMMSVSDDEISSFQSVQSFIPRDKFVKVVVTVALGTGEYWVRKVEDNIKLNQLFEKLRDYANSQQLIDPIENVKCVLEFAGAWYRATILNNFGEKCKIFFHDFGTVDEGIVTKVASIGDFEDIPFFARQIRLSNNSSEELKSLKGGDGLLVKTLRIEPDGIVVVEAKESPDEKITGKMVKNLLNESPKSYKEQFNEDVLETSKMQNLPNILQKLKVGLVGVVIFPALVDQGKFSIALVPDADITDYGNLIEDLQANCLTKLKEEPNYKPKIGELVCGLSTEDEWYRGIILSMKPKIQLAAIDEARVFNPTKVVPMPKNYRDICSYGLKCEFIKDAAVPLNKIGNLTGHFEVVKILADNELALIHIHIVDGPVFSAQATISKWNPKSEQISAKQTQLISGQKVAVTDFSITQNLVYVRSQETEDVKWMTSLEQNISKVAQYRKPLVETPVIGQIVLAEYTLDGNFYRAIVKKIQGDHVTIEYFDYGNDELTTTEKLFELPDELKEYPPCVTKVKLKDVPEHFNINPEVVEYLTKLIGDKEILKCMFTGHLLEEGVIFKNLNNESVNRNILLLLTPSPEKQNSVSSAQENKIYELNDLPVFKLGEVGDEVEAILLHCYENGSMIFGSCAPEALEAISPKMVEKIEKYVASTTDFYIPIENELCIAKYKDSFSRALCLESNCAPGESLIFFIDWGNTEKVKHQDIRMFTEEFAKIGAYGILCNIIPTVPQNKLTDEIAKRICELAPVDVSYIIQIIDIDEDSIPSIYIPDIHLKLIEEKLL